MIAGLKDDESIFMLKTVFRIQVVIQRFRIQLIEKMDPNPYEILHTYNEK